VVVVAVAVVVDDVHSVETEQTRRPKARLADSRAAVPERDPTPRASFRHPQDPYKEHSANPRNCYIRRGSITKNDHIYK